MHLVKGMFNSIDQLVPYLDCFASSPVSLISFSCHLSPLHDPNVRLYSCLLPGLSLINLRTYGEVRRAVLRSTGGVPVAIKQFKGGDSDDKIRMTALREISVLKSLQHDNIVCLLDAFRDKGKISLVFEYVDRALLADIERYAEAKRNMPLDDVRSVIYQLVQALDFIHEKNVVHRDVKPENILLTEDGLVKLCDFGFARHVPGKTDGAMTDYVATRWYRAPELLVKSTNYDFSVDIWAVGCLVFETITGRPLFAGDSDMDQLARIVASLGPLPPTIADAALRELPGWQMPYPDKLRNIRIRFIEEGVDPGSIGLRDAIDFIEVCQSSTSTITI